MKIITILIVAVIAIFLLLPILSGSMSAPTGISVAEVGVSIGGIAGYWIEVAKVAYGSL